MRFMLKILPLRNILTTHLHQVAALIIFLIFALLLTGCASVPDPPTRALQAAELAIENADRARAIEHAAPELGEARQQLAAARNAVQAEEMLRAERLAEQARANAELALAKSEAVKAQAINDEMQKNIDVLKQEIQRNSGGQK